MDDNITFLVVGDPHIKLGDPSSDILIEKIIESVKEHCPTYLVLMGDILHNHDKTSIGPMKKATDLINTCAAICKVIVIIGNHDRETNNDFCTDLHFFNAYEGNSNVVIVWKPISIVIGQRNFIFCPYVPKGRFIEALRQIITFKGKRASKIKIDDVEVIFAHQEFYSCSLSSACRSVDGDKWEISYPMVLSGHIHKYHCPQPNITYVGTPRQTDFGEENDTFKRIWLYNVNKVSGLLDKNALPIDLNMPVYRSYSCTFDDIENFKIRNADQYCRLYITVPKNIDAKEVYRLEGISKYIKKRVKVLLNRIDVNKINDEINKFNVDLVLPSFNEKTFESSLKEIIDGISDIKEKEFCSKLLSKISSDLL